MFRQLSRKNCRSRTLTIATALAAIGVVWATQPAAAQEQPSSSTPAQTQRPIVPPPRQQVAPAAPVPSQQTQPNATNKAGAANTNVQNMLKKLFPGAAGGASTTQPAVTAPAPANTTTRASANAAVEALQQQLKAGSGNSRNTTNPLQVASLTNRQTTARAVQSRTFIGHPGPAGSTEAVTRSGNVVRTAADGSVIDVHNPRNGMYIHHGLDGNRQILVARPDGSRIYASSRGVQYVQHPYVFRGRVFDHRTYYAQGQLFHQLYRPYRYGGTVLDVYATTRYYDANFYQWATSRLNAPQPFNWGYNSSSPAPWFAYYKGYFTPDRSYSSPLSWLADFVLAATLAASYKMQQPSSAPPTGNGAPVVTPEVKQMIAEEVGRQVRQESVEAQQNAQNRDPPPGAGSVVQELGDHQPHVLVAAADLDLVDATGRRCMISAGDVVQVVSEANAASGSADAVVLSSKGGGECEPAARVEVALNDLQEMQNHMRETVDQGMAGTPAAKKSASVTPAFAASAPPPDPNAAHELDQQQQIAAAVEG